MDVTHVAALVSARVAEIANALDPTLRDIFPVSAPDGSPETDAFEGILERPWSDSTADAHLRDVTALVVVAHRVRCRRRILDAMPPPPSPRAYVGRTAWTTHGHVLAVAASRLATNTDRLLARAFDASAREARSFDLVTGGTFTLSDTVLRHGICTGRWTIAETDTRTRMAVRDIPDGEAPATVVIAMPGDAMPETVMSGLTGLEIGRIVRHPLFDGLPPVRILTARIEPGAQPTIHLGVENLRCPFAPPPPGADVSFMTAGHEVLDRYGAARSQILEWPYPVVYQFEMCAGRYAANASR